MNWLVIGSRKWDPDVTTPTVVVPYANERSEPATYEAVRLNLEMQSISPRYEPVEGPFAYDRLFRRLWAEDEPFVLVEHDVLPWPGAIQQLWTCARPWCAFEYLMLGDLRVALGCTKFDPRRMGPCPLPDEPQDWHQMDWHIIDILTTRLQSAHLHEPAVSHLNRRVARPVA